LVKDRTAVVRGRGVGKDLNLDLIERQKFGVDCLDPVRGKNQGGAKSRMYKGPEGTKIPGK